MPSTNAVPRNVRGGIHSTALGDLTDTEAALVRLSRVASAPRAFEPDAETVIYRLEEAGKTLLALPSRDCLPRGMASFWPDVVHAAVEAYGYDPESIRPPIPAADAITRMDEAWRWIHHIPLQKGARYDAEPWSRHGGAILRRIVLMRALVNPVTERHRWSYRRMATAFGVGSPETIRAWHGKGVDMIVRQLKLGLDRLDGFRAHEPYSGDGALRSTMPTRPPIFRPAHLPLPAAARQRYDADRGSAAARGYDHQWRSFRAMFLERHPLCTDCQQAGRVTPANEVHHVRKVRNAPELRLVEANCMALCQGCHSARTARGE